MNKQHFTVAIFLLIVPVLLNAQNKTERSRRFSVEGKEVALYTTAQGSDYRLTKTATSPFSAKPQPEEGEFSVIVDPSRTFQTMIGIGGALTDASAETF